MSGQFVPLEQTCDFLSGYAWSAANFQAHPVGLPIIRIQNVDAVRDSEFVYWPGEYDERFVVRGGDLLLTLSGSFRAVIWQGPDALLNQRVVKLTPKPGYSLDWLLHVLRNGLNTISGLGRHALVSNVALADLRQLKVPSQTSEEQRRIAAILDQAETLRTQRRQALAHLDTLTQSLFLDMFGDPVVNDRGWPHVPFGSLLEKIESGWSPVCLDRPAEGNEWAVLKLGAVTSCEFKPHENKALPDSVAPDASIEVKSGDLLFSRKNTYELVAACVLVDEAPPRLMMSDLIFRFRLNADAQVNHCYLHRLLIHPSKRQEVQKLAGGSSSSMPNISKAKLAEFLIELPPVPLQQTFATRIQAIEALKATHRTALAQLDALFASLQQRAFAGEL